ncbi:MAG: hypothetical protein KKC84_07880, partial [Candidatus Omnitrophica bacterium]|nr:hypothetical protein [Candidatus Omnitrophota bacterium]
MKKKWFVFIPLAIILAVNLYFRCFPVYFPQFKLQAKSIVDNMITQRAASEIFKKFPQFYGPARDRLIKSRVAEYQKSNKANWQTQINDIYRSLKDKYQDAEGRTYMMELDCWHWSRYVENVLKTGRPGDQVINGRQVDTFMLAPNGHDMLGDNFFYYISAFCYRVFSLIKIVPLFTFLYYLPLFFAAVFISIIYLLTLRHGGYLGAVVSSLFIGLAPILLPRSCAGWFDRDVLTLLFPLAIVWSYTRVWASSSLRHRNIWICATAFLTAVFSATWTQWWFILAVIIFYESIVVGFHGFRTFVFKKENTGVMKAHLISIGLYAGLTLVWILILAGTGPLEPLYEHIRLIITLNKPLMASIWPNVYSTVGELRSANPKEIANSMGSIYIFWFGVVSLFLLTFYAVTTPRFSAEKRTAVFIFTVWFFSMLYASFRGVRFVMFLLVPLGICLGWMIDEIYHYCRRKKNMLGTVAVVAAVVVYSTFSLSKANKTAKSIFPLMDDTWYKVLNIINEKTPQEAIINSWWDFGDWFKVVARRRVIFDGQSQFTPQAHWMAKIILSGDEEKAVRILRMLNNGGNRAYDIIHTYIKEPLQAVLLLDNILSLSPDDVKKSLQQYLPPLAVEEVMRLFFNDPPPAVFVVDNSMQPKMGAISYLGNWDFSKVYIAQNMNMKEKGLILERLKKLGCNEAAVERFYQEKFIISDKEMDEWLSHRVLFYSGIVNAQEREGLVYFENGFVYDPKAHTIRS